MPGIFSTLFPKKIKKAGVFIPKFLRKAPGTVTDDKLNRVNTDLTDLRFAGDTKEVVRSYAKVHPDTSQAINSFIRFIITDSYTAVSKDLDTGLVNKEATELIQSFLLRLDNLPPNYDGYYPDTSLSSLSETLLFQLLCNGVAQAELVFDKALLPSHLQAISTNNLKYEVKGKRLIPYIDDGDSKVYLDSPAIRTIVLNQDPETPYADSFFEAAVQAVISSEEYRNDLRRAFSKASMPRVVAKIDTEKFKASLTPDVLYDPKKLKAVMDDTIAYIEDELNNLNPEDCLVSFDTVSIDHLSAGNNSSHEYIDVHSKVIDGLVSSGLKTLPAIIGRSSNQTTASTESVLFLKMAENIQQRLNRLYSSLLTLAARVHGYDVVVNFSYAKPNLRPAVELASFEAIKQSMILEQLSYGFISDEEASVLITGDIPSGNYTPLSGTGFREGVDTNVPNPYSNTSVTTEGVNNTKVQKDTKADNNKPKTSKTA